MPTRADRIEGGLIGLLVGDALGVPYEFSNPAALPSPELIDFTPPSDFARAHQGTPPGTWSDDGAQALCLLDSLLTETGLSPPQATGLKAPVVRRVGVSGVFGFSPCHVSAAFVSIRQKRCPWNRRLYARPTKRS